MPSNDYPDGFRRNLPGHTVDLESGFSLPWAQSTSLVIGAGGNSSFTLSFTDPDFIYYVDMINLSPQAYKEFYMFVEVNDIVYMAGANMGFLTMPLRTNPSIFFINGDSLKVTVYNLDSSQRTFVLHINGSKILRPDVFGHPPSAYYSASAYVGITPWSSVITDGSSFDPTSWEYYLVSGVLKSSSQSPTLTITEQGILSLLLKASNQYGYDNYCSPSSFISAKVLDPATFTEVDPNNHISVSGYSVGMSNINTSEDAYLYRDFGVDFVDGFDFLIMVNSTAMVNGAVAIPFRFSNFVGSAPGVSGVGMRITFYQDNSGVHKMYLSYDRDGAMVAEDSMTYTVGIATVCRVTHVAGSNITTLTCYSDITLRSAYWSLDVDNAICNTKFRYVYLASSYKFNTNKAASAVNTKSGLISPVF